MLIDITRGIFRHISYDTTSKSTCYLTHHYLYSVGILNHHCAVLVLMRRFRQICRNVSSLIMAHIFHGAWQRYPIRMNREDAHKNRYLHHLFTFEILVFLYRFDDDNTSVGWGNDKIFVVHFYLTGGISEEIQKESKSKYWNQQIDKKDISAWGFNIYH